MGDTLSESSGTPEASLHSANAAAQALGADRVFRELVALHGRRLYHFVLRRIGHASDAEDVAQQTFIEAARAYASFRGESALSTWLYGIALNLVRVHRPRARRSIEDEADDAATELPDSAANPECRGDHAQLVQGVQADLAELAPEMRQVLLLVAMDDLSYEEAAQWLAVPIGTIRSRVSRARMRLRRRMSGRGAVLPF